MSSTSNSVIKKEFVVSRNLVIPVYRNIASAPEPVIGSIAYDASTQGIVVSNGITWSSPSASPATPTVAGLVFGLTSISPTTTTSYGNGSGSAPNGNVFIGWRAGFNNNGAQTGLTIVGRISASQVQTATNKTIVGDSAGISGSQQNSTAIGAFTLLSGTGSDNSAVGFGSQSAGSGSGNSSMGSNALGAGGASTFNNCIGIGFYALSTNTSSSGLINIGSAPGLLFWNPGSSTDVVYFGNGTSLSSNITNVIALGRGNFSGATANNTFVVADGITQWRSLGLTASASANVLQFDPVTGLITQAASSQRFKENIREPQKGESSDILDMKVRSYEIDGKTDHGFISEDIPEKYATFDTEGRRNGVKMLRIIMSLLSEVQELNRQISLIEARA
nr:peptidase [Marseillevirus futianmevirus]